MILLFRQFNKETNRFHYWGTHDGMFVGPMYNSTSSKLLPSDIFTGQFDTSKKEIYENDLCQVTFNSGIDGVVVNEVGIVRYMQPEWRFAICFNSSFILPELKDVKVIGNIHQHKFLAKQHKLRI